MLSGVESAFHSLLCRLDDFTNRLIFLVFSIKKFESDFLA